MPVRTGPPGTVIGASQSTPVVDHQQCSAELPRRKGTMLALHVAAAHDESEKRPDLYAQWLDDAGGHAAGPAPPGPTGRIHHVSDGGQGRRAEGQIADVGYLQHRCSEVRPSQCPLHSVLF